MNTVRLIPIICTVVVVLSVCIYLYAALSVINWKETVSRRVTALSEEVELLITKVNLLEEHLAVNDDALDRYYDNMKNILDHTEEIIKDNARLSSELSVLALDIRGARDESTDVLDNGSGSDDTAL